MDPTTTSAPDNFTFEPGDQNQSKTSVCFLPHNGWTFTFVPIYILLISALGIVLNVFVLMVFCFHKKACSTAEIYLSNLAAADLVLVSFLPFWAANVYNRYNWTFGRAMCKVVNASILMNAYCSIYFLVLISIDRYLVLVHPMSCQITRRPKYAKWGCLLVWILGFLFSLPALIYRDVTLPNYQNITRCLVNNVNNSVQLTNDALISVFGFIIPIFIISFCAVKIIKTLRSRLWEGVNTKKTDHKATSLILSVLLAFLICWVPYHLMKTLYVLWVKNLPDCDLIRVLLLCYQIFTYLAFFNSVLNPILYVIVGKNFRKKVKELFRQRNHRRTNTLLTQTSTNLSRVFPASHMVIDGDTQNLCYVLKRKNLFTWVTPHYNRMLQPEITQNVAEREQSQLSLSSQARHIDNHDATLQQILELQKSNQSNLQEMGGGQYRTDPNKVKAVVDLPVPENRKQLQRFLGFANFYRRFIKGYSQVAAPLTQLTSTLRTFRWTPEADSAFNKLKDLFSSAPILCHPDPKRQFILEVDASDTGVGAVLSQRSSDDGEREVSIIPSSCVVSALSWPITEEVLEAQKVEPDPKTGPKDRIVWMYRILSCNSKY
ncbi:type-1 angiotensin II receptor A-like [Nematolebias whitei]|uniref:type-1 angiotensin II receptor A-like n=1 Tax=Nematolebias whitei TaxID=451745 RepID=UPI0018985126|nr:type-1 angiotensin II receptor A-like [Nematolebias whitei]